MSASRRSWAVGAMLAISVGPAAAAPPEGAPPKDVNGVEQARQLVKEALTSRGLAEVTVSERAGPFDTQVVEAQSRAASPGADRAVCVVGEGALYGPACGGDVSSLLLRHGCSQQKAPSGKTLEGVVELLRQAYFDGLLAADGPVEARCNDGRLELEFDRVSWPSGTRERVTVVASAKGPLDVTVSRGAAPKTLTSGVSALRAALAQDDAGAIQSAVREVAALPNVGTNAEALSLLAQVSAMAGAPVLAMVVVEVLPDSAATDRAVALAWRSMPKDMQTERLSWVRGLHGAKRASRLEKALRRKR